MEAAPSEDERAQRRDNRRFLWILAALVVGIALLLVGGAVLSVMREAYQTALPRGAHA